MLLKDFIKKQRKIYNFTQNELADNAGVGLRFIREMERCKPTLRMDRIGEDSLHMEDFCQLTDQTLNV